MRKRLWLLALGVMIFVTCMAGAARADLFVVPNSLANVEGNTNNAYPFNIGQFNLTSQRYQQVYGASEFSSLTVPGIINEIAFRPDLGTGNAFSANLTNVQINLSTTSAAADALSATFANNIGANDMVVYSGALPLSSTDTGGPPHNFDIVISLQFPFKYDPALGNLLMDVRNFGGGGTTQFDAVLVMRDSVSRVYTFNGGVNSTTADAIDTYGLVTRFTVEPIPEPTTLLLLASGLMGLAGYGRKKFFKK